VTTSEQQLDVVRQFFEGPRDLDRLSLMSDDVEWWNGLAKFPAAPGQTTFRGRDEIGRIVLGRAGSPRQPNGRHVDRYDLATLSYADVQTIVDGPFVFRQHTYRATTMKGRPYENVYGFLFRFDETGRIARIWEHWGTLQAWETLFQGPVVVHDFDLVLQTTPSVRRRLDLTRPVERETIDACLNLAVHAPNGSNQQPYRFLFVDEPDRKAALADIYRAAMADFVNRPRTEAAEDHVDRTSPQQQRVAASVSYLAQHLQDVPVLCIPLVAGRTDGLGLGAHAERTSVFWQASRWGSVIPTLWSFMLALRSRGLGTAWTTLTLLREREVAELLGIPFDKWMQVGLFPVAHTIGTDFRITPRQDAASFTRWNEFASR
jgi:nitroreductase/ketosteroid isomerase-like protein